MAVRFCSFSRLALIGTSASGILWSSSSEAHHGVGVKPSSVLGARRQSGLEAFGSKYFGAHRARWGEFTGAIDVVKGGLRAWRLFWSKDNFMVLDVTLESTRKYEEASMDISWEIDWLESFRHMFPEDEAFKIYELENCKNLFQEIH